MHAIDISKAKTVVIRSSDTDVLGILTYHVIALSRDEATVFMDVGHDGNNNRRFINVTKLSKVLGPSLCKALPGLHAFTGCDFTAAFSRKGKVRPLEIVQRSSIYQDAFKHFGETVTLDVDIMPVIEAFVCSLYGKQNFTHVDDVRLALFRTKYAPKLSNKPLAKMKGADASFLQPTQSSAHISFLSYGNMLLHQQ